MIDEQVNCMQEIGRSMCEGGWWIVWGKSSELASGVKKGVTCMQLAVNKIGWVRGRPNVPEGTIIGLVYQISFGDLPNVHRP